MTDGLGVGEQSAGPATTWHTGRVVAAVAVAAVAIGGAALGLAVSQGGSAGSSQAGSCGNAAPKLTVKGTGQATAVPDVLTMVFEVTTLEPTAAASLAKNNTQVSQALLALASQGVTRKDVQTSNLSVQPMYTYPKNVPMLSGYQVVNTVTATLHNVKKSGGAIDALVNATGNPTQIQSLAFSFDKPLKVEAQARTMAVHQAVSDARAMASAAGRRLGPVCSLTDSTSTPQILSNGLDQAFAGATTAESSVGAPTPVPVEAGTQSESDQVTMIYGVENR